MLATQVSRVLAALHSHVVGRVVVWCGRVLAGGGPRPVLRSTLGERPILPDEQFEMLALFGNLGVYLEPHEICDCIAIDPCRIGNFSWDTTDFSDFICSNRRLAENLDRDITNFLESLRGGPGR